MSQICPELDKMHSNEFINVPSAYKTRGFQRQNPLVGLLEIKFWAKKNIKHNLGRKILELHLHLAHCKDCQSQSESFFLLLFNFKTCFTTQRVKKQLLTA